MVTHIRAHTQTQIKIIKKKGHTLWIHYHWGLHASGWLKAGLECILLSDHRAITKDRQYGEKHQKEKDVLICCDWHQNCESLKLWTLAWLLWGRRCRHEWRWQVGSWNSAGALDHSKKKHWEPTKMCFSQGIWDISMGINKHFTRNEYS